MILAADSLLQKLMASLLECIECGGTVSSKASQCPRCSTKYPLGVKCTVCCKMFKRSEALKFVRDYGETEQPNIIRFFHHSCYKQVSQVRIGRSRTSCPVCKHGIEFDTSSSVNCPNCGHHILTKLEKPSFAACCYCDFPLNTRLEVAIKEVPRQFLDGWVTETLYAHKICHTPERQEEEKRQQKKEQINQIINKKRQTKNFRLRQSRNNKETLAVSIILAIVMGILVGSAGGVISHYILGFGSTWKSAALLGFFSVSILTIVTVWIARLLD